MTRWAMAVIFGLLLTGCDDRAERNRALLDTVPPPPVNQFDSATEAVLDDAWQAVRNNSNIDGLPDAALAVSFARLGQLYMANSLDLSARQALDAALTLQPDHHEWTYLSALASERLGQVADAIDRYSAAVTLRPDHTMSRVRLAIQLTTDNQRELARLAYREVLQLEPDHHLALSGLANLMLEEGLAAEALPMLESVLESNPEASKLYFNLAQAHRQIGNQEQAQAAIEQIGEQGLVISDPIMEKLQTLITGAGAHIVMANRARNNGQLEVARSHLMSALAFEPDNVSALHNMGYLLGVQGQPQQALVHFRKALSIDPDNLNVMADAAVAQVAIGQYQEAADLYQRVLTLNPSDQEARSRLQQIEAYLSQDR